LNRSKIIKQAVSDTLAFYKVNNSYNIHFLESEMNPFIEKHKKNWERPICVLTSCLMVSSLLLRGFRPTMSSNALILVMFFEFWGFQRVFVFFFMWSVQMRGRRWDTLYIGVLFAFYKANTSILFDFYCANNVFSKIPLGGGCILRVAQRSHL
jgi:hypothetical protein